MGFKNSILVMSHPDDETIFASSILREVKKIIIVFSATYNTRLSKNRGNLLKKYPLSNCLFLNFHESKGPSNLFYLLNGRETKHGIKIEDKTYEDNKDKIYKKITKYIKDCDSIVTHNPWGEYGNHEHIQLYRIMNEIALKRNLKLFVTGYTSFASSRLMYMNNIKLKDKFFRRKIDINLFNNLKELYLKTGSWTYYDAYQPPTWEIFYEVNLSINYEFQTLIAPSVLQTSLPFNLINYRIFKKTTLFLLIPFWSFISKLIKRLLRSN